MVFTKGHKINEGRKHSFDWIEKVKKELEEKVYSKRRGKTHEEIYGLDKSLNIKKIQSRKLKLKHSLGLRKKVYKKIGESQKGNHNSLSTEFKKGHKIRNTGRTRFKKGRVGNLGKKFPIEKYPNFGMRAIRKNIILPKKDTSIEVKIQEFLSLLHIEFFTHKYMNIEHGYQCDILIPEQKGIKQKTIIEADGCFFHSCPICKHKEYYWTKKRKEIDKLRTKELQKKGFRVIRLWEHEIRVMEVNDLRSKIYGKYN